MMSTVNEHVAHRPKRGMIVHSAIILPLGKWLFKLGHSVLRGVPQTDAEIVASPWWISQADYEEIAQRSNLSDQRTASVWRHYGAIARQWGGSGDRLVKAKVVAPLKAYIGPGTIIDLRNQGDDVDLPLWVPPPYITQVYVPGLKEQTLDGLGVVANRALSQVQIEVI